MYGIDYAEREFINKKWTKLHVWYLGIILGQYGTRLWGFQGPRPDPGDLKKCKFIMYGIDNAEREFINEKCTKLHVWYLGIMLGQYGTRLWGFLGPRPDPEDLKNCKFILYGIDYAKRKFINKKWTKYYVWYLGIILGQYGTSLLGFQGPRSDPGDLKKCKFMKFGIE